MKKLFFVILICFLSNSLFCDEKLNKKIRPFFVQVEMEILKDESPFLDSTIYDEFLDYYESKKKYKTYGISINENTVVISQLPMMRNRYKNIKIKTTDGKEYAAELSGYDLERDLQTLTVEGKLIFPHWKKFDLEKNEDSVYESIIIFQDNTPYLKSNEISSVIKTLPFFENEENIYPPNDYENIPKWLSLLVNKKGDPLGLQTRNFYKINGKQSIFTSKDLNIISMEEVIEKEEEILSKLHKEIFFVQLYFRQSQESASNRMESDSNFSEGSAEAKVFGFLLNEKGELLLPFNIPIEKIKDIEKIEIKSPTKTYSAEFKGAFATIGGTIITCQELKGVKPNLEFNFLAEEEIILVLSLKWNTPDDYQFEVFPNRLNIRLYGVENRVSYITKQNLNIKESIFFNIGLKICGINTRYKNIENIEELNEDDYRYGPEQFNCIINADIKNELQTPEFFLDNRAIQLNRQDALTPTWLGVNVQTPSVALLEHLKVLDKTKNGSIGLLVTQIYANSPAVKIGLKPLDVLLSVAYVDSDREFEFIKGNNFYQFDNMQFDNENQSRFNFFPPRKNEVTNVLSKLETGKTVILKYLREGKQLTASFILEKAPKDFSNADKYVDDDFGLHVKDITYEVREALHLKESETGVIISEVEQGKAASIAQLYVYYIILKVDNVTIVSTKNFQEIITAKKADGITEFSFTILFLGKTSLIKVNLKS